MGLAMAADGAGERLIHARRFHSRYLVPRDHPAPEQVRAHLDEIAVTVLRDALGATLYQYLDPQSDAIWFIRRLDLDVSINAAWDDDRVARVWAAQVARTLATAIESGGDDGNVIRFENRTAYIRQFITDLVDDCAWSRWYYHTFEGLKMLPVAAAIRTVVCDNPESGINALAQLSPEQRTRVISILTVQDARLVLQALPFARAQLTMRNLLETAWRAYDTSPVNAEYADDDRAALSLCLHVASTEPSSLDRSLQVAARAILRLLRVAQRSPEALQTIRRILETGSAAALYVVVSPEDAGILSPLVEGDPVWLDTVFAGISARATGAVTSDSAPEVTFRQSPFGGMFLLLPIMSDLPIDEVVQDWPACGDTSAASLVRFIVLAKCLGGTCLSRLLMDPVAREMTGVDPRVRLQDVVAWYAARTRAQHAVLVSMAAEWMRSRLGVNYQSAPPDSEPPRRAANRHYMAFVDAINESPSAFRAFGLVAYAVLTSFARKLPGFSQSSLPHLRSNFLDCTAAVEDQPARRVVQLTRPPLDLVLNMTGLSRMTYRLPWLDGRSITLFPGGG